MTPKVGLFLVLTFLAILTLGLAGTSIQAATPTPTRTLRPIPPTATSIYIYLHATPTGLTVVPSGITMDFQADPVLTADLTINMYRYFNKDHLIDLIASIFLFLVAVWMLIKMIGTNTRTNN